MCFARGHSGHSGTCIHACPPPPPPPLSLSHRPVYSGLPRRRDILSSPPLSPPRLSRNQVRSSAAAADSPPCIPLPALPSSSVCVRTARIYSYTSQQRETTSTVWVAPALESCPKLTRMSYTHRVYCVPRVPYNARIYKPQEVQQHVEAHDGAYAHAQKLLLTRREMSERVIYSRRILYVYRYSARCTLYAHVRLMEWEIETLCLERGVMRRGNEWHSRPCRVSTFPR